MALQGFLSEVRTSSAGAPDDASFNQSRAIDSFARVAESAFEGHNREQEAQNTLSLKRTFGGWVGDRVEEDIGGSLRASGLDQGSVDAFLKNEGTQADNLAQMEQSGNVSQRTRVALERNLAFRRALAVRPEYASELSSIYKQAFGTSVAGVMDIQKQEAKEEAERLSQFDKVATDALIRQGGAGTAAQYTQKQRIAWYRGSEAEKEAIHNANIDDQMQDKIRTGKLNDSVNIPLQQVWAGKAIQVGTDMFSQRVKDLQTGHDPEVTVETIESDWAQFQMDFASNTPNMPFEERQQYLGIIQRYVDKTKETVDGKTDMQTLQMQRARDDIAYAKYQKMVREADQEVNGTPIEQAAADKKKGNIKSLQEGLNLMNSISDLSVSKNPHLRSIVSEPKMESIIDHTIMNLHYDAEDPLAKKDGGMPIDATPPDRAKAAMVALVQAQSTGKFSPSQLRKLGYSTEKLMADLPEEQRNDISQTFLKLAGSDDVGKIIAQNPSMYKPMAREARGTVQRQLVLSLDNFQQDLQKNVRQEDYNPGAIEDLLSVVEIDPWAMRKGVVRYNLKPLEEGDRRKDGAGAEKMYYQHQEAIDQYNEEHGADISTLFNQYHNLSGQPGYGKLWSVLSGNNIEDTLKKIGVTQSGVE